MATGDAAAPLALTASWLLAVGDTPTPAGHADAAVDVLPVPCPAAAARAPAAVDWAAAHGMVEGGSAVPERALLERHYPAGLVPRGVHLHWHPDKDAAAPTEPVDPKAAAEALCAALAAQLRPAGPWVVSYDHPDGSGAVQVSAAGPAVSLRRAAADAAPLAVVLARLTGVLADAVWPADRPEEVRWLDRPLVYFPSANVALSPSDADAAAPCGEVFTAAVSSATGRADKPHAPHKRGPAAARGMPAVPHVEAELLLCAPPTAATAWLDAPAIAWSAPAAASAVRRASLRLDVLAVARVDESATVLAARLDAAARRQAAWLAHETAEHQGALAAPTPLHFRPLAAVPWLPVTVPLPYTPEQATTDPSIELAHAATRKALHVKLGLPLDRPLLRVAQAVRWSTDDAPSKGPRRLHDVHLHVRAPDVVVGRQYLVSGSYAYYHYLQDNFNDNGWGCSYRSFQTLCSWFVLQNYSSRPVPTHREMQQALVALGDKPASFVGSRDWIGSVEISLLLDHFYQASCRIIHLSSGSEFPSKASELARHFETHGTPVMIGGGVLAYTLLGIDWNRETGGIRFLILDPHYTGADDVDAVIAKGWCAWKPASLFLPNAFYNLCLPLRPNTL